MKPFQRYCGPNAAVEIILFVGECGVVLGGLVEWRDDAGSMRKVGNQCNWS